MSGAMSVATKRLDGGMIAVDVFGRRQIHAVRYVAHKPAPSLLAASRRRGGEARHRLLADRKIDQSGENAKPDGEPPNHIIGTGALIQIAPEPDADKRANLMREKHEPEKGRHESRAEHQRDEL